MNDPQKQDRKDSGVSRRDFLKGSGASAAGAAHFEGNEE